jgi:hypothetical protein
VKKIKNGQSRETGNIGYTRHKTKTNKTKNKTQDEDKQNKIHNTTQKHVQYQWLKRKLKNAD